MGVGIGKIMTRGRNIVPNIFVIFAALLSNLSNKNDQTWFFNALTFARSLEVFGLGFQQLRDLQT